MIQLALWLPFFILMTLISLLGFSAFTAKTPNNWLLVLLGINREARQEKLNDNIITSLSHELLTPLAAIKGYNELLKMTANDRLDKRQLESIENIGQSANDLLGLVQKILDLSQIDNGNLGIDQALIDFNKLIKTEAKNWSERMNEKDLSFAIHSFGESIWVKGDYRRLTTAVSNLIENAHNYTLPGGKVNILVTRKNGYARIDIKDSGVGIPRKAQKCLFNRFFRAIHNEKTFQVSGLGLGLYISKAIIEAHEGQIWMSSRSFQGSTFSLILPTVDPQP